MDTAVEVTSQSVFSSNLETVAAVDEQGVVHAGVQRGEAAVMARYMGQVAVFYAVLPHGPPSTEISGWVPQNFIDQLVADKWERLGLQPSPVCDDSTFIRRLTIDIGGRLPTAEESRRFLGDDHADKRQTLIDKLLDSPDYPAYFATRWGTILRNSNLAGSDRAAYAFHNWLRNMLAQNRPYDEFVRGIVAASGEWQDAPAINWYWQSRDDQLHTVTADTAQLFLGLRLQCARCHHHPYERWSQEDYYGLTGFFTRVGARALESRHRISHRHKLPRGRRIRRPVRHPSRNIWTARTVSLLRRMIRATPWLTGWRVLTIRFLLGHWSTDTGATFSVVASSRKSMICGNLIRHRTPNSCRPWPAILWIISLT